MPEEACLLPNPPGEEHPGGGGFGTPPPWDVFLNIPEHGFGQHILEDLSLLGLGEDQTTFLAK